MTPPSGMPRLRIRELVCGGGVQHPLLQRRKEKTGTQAKLGFTVRPPRRDPAPAGFHTQAPHAVSMLSDSSHLQETSYPNSPRFWSHHLRFPVADGSVRGTDGERYGLDAACLAMP
jgi:hypothetical protein